jgi:ABC-2 type transport system ATP-binding protein
MDGYFKSGGFKMQVISFRNVAFAYDKKQVLQDVSITIGKGEVVCLLGANASGKTTMMGLAVTLLSPLSGSISWFDGKDKLKEIRRRIGYVPQEIALYQNMSVIDNLRFFGKLYGLKGEALQKSVKESAALAELDLTERKRVRDLSGGIRRRANMAAALLHNPDLLVMDEPTVGIDLPSRQAIISALFNLKNEGKSILFSSHYPDEVSTLATRLLVLKDGQITTDFNMESLATPEERLTEAIHRLAGH